MHTTIECMNTEKLRKIEKKKTLINTYKKHNNIHHTKHIQAKKKNYLHKEEKYNNNSMQWKNTRTNRFIVRGIIGI